MKKPCRAGSHCVRLERGLFQKGSKGDTMKIEKKLWITLFVFGLFAICFSRWIFSQSTVRENLFWDNTIKCETKELTDGKIKSENIALPKDFNIPKSILFKTTHTIAEVWLDGEKIYEYGNEKDEIGRAHV